MIWKAKFRRFLHFLVYRRAKIFDQFYRRFQDLRARFEPWLWILLSVLLGQFNLMAVYARSQRLLLDILVIFEQYATRSDVSLLTECHRRIAELMLEV